jgi:4-hydroxybenzoate polyprenyltransferase
VKRRSTATETRRRLHGLVRLTRYDEHMLFVVVTTLLGARVGGADLDWRLGLVLVANWLAVGWAFMINDVEDADDDARDRDKAARNPIAAGFVSRRTGRVAGLGVAICAAAAYVPLGPGPFTLGISTLALGWLYSWRRVRLKAVPGVDLVAHALLLAGLQFLCAARTFDPAAERPWLVPFAFVTVVSAYGQLFNQLRDLRADVAAGIRHTVARIGPAAARAAMVALLVVAGALALYALAVGIVPLWVLVAGTITAAVCLAGLDLAQLRGGGSDDLHARGYVVGALTMIIWMVGERLIA